jgi:hypothetical protein
MTKIRWYDANKVLPKTNEFGGSRPVLCIGDTGSNTPVVCWYNVNRNHWIVMSTSATNDPIEVLKWAYIDNIMPKGVKIYVKVGR